MQSGTYLDRHNSEARLANSLNSFHSDPDAVSGWLNLIDPGSACDIPFDAIDLDGRLIMKIGIIICDRYSSCGGGKCFRAMRERVGGFKRYPADEPLDIVGYSTCNGCPGGNVEYVPEEMIKNGVEVIHLATGLVVGYPPCPRTEYFKEFIESRYGIPVVIGTHPIPQKYVLAHQGLPSWGKLSTMTELLETEDLRKAYD
jgi:predicted metal-binding protein